jgi:aminoacyl-tRNA hydrolase
MRTLIEDLGRRRAALARRARYLLDWHVYRRFHLKYAEIYRSRLRGVTFVGVTGSVGKTSAETLITAILASTGSAKHAAHAGNRLHHIAQTITATRPSDDFCVLELGAERPGFFDPMLKLVRPTIGVVTTVGDDHHKAFGSREAIAAEKGKLIAALPPEGTAVLNADDPLVWAMRERCRGRIVSYGLGEGVDLQARDIRSPWPERLSFTVRYQGKDYPVQTQLCGKHWIVSALAALAAGMAAGVSLAEAAKAMSQVPPAKARMEPVTTPDGITFLRDDLKAPFWGMQTVFEFLREAEAARKIIVLGTLADYHGTVRSRYHIIGQEALKVADVVIFVGKMATYGLRAQRFAREGQSLLAFSHIREASAALQGLLRSGDLVVLKGAMRADHLSRLYHVRMGPVACWRMNCDRNLLCDDCRLLRPKDSEMTVSESDAEPPEVANQVPTGSQGPAGAVQVLVGIGNPGEKFRNTPHNAGFSVMDILAERHGLTWKGRERAEVAQMDLDGRHFLLVKPLGYVNNTGEVLAALSRSTGFSATDCILVQDDIHLPAGTVRMRMKGGDGGHLGVRSVLVTFQTSDIPRIKIGVAAAANQVPTVDYLVSPMPPLVSTKVMEGCTAAAERLLQLAKSK